MHLNSDEKSILAYFRSEADATRAAQALGEHGFDDWRIDAIVSTPSRAVYSSPATSLSAMVLGNRTAAASSGPYHPLLGADPHVSGMSGGERQPQPDYAYLITVVTSSSKSPEAVQILRNHAALL